MEILIIYILILNYIFCITSENTIYSLFWLIFFFFNCFLLLFIWNIKIISILILIIYVGAIAVLFLFSIMILNFSKKITNINNYIFFYIPLIIIYILFLTITSDINIHYEDYLNWKIINFNFLSFEIGYLLYNNLFSYIIISGFILFLPMLLIIVIL